MVRSCAGLLVGLGAFLTPNFAEGEGATGITKGSRVRIVAPRIAERSFIGVLEAIDGNALLVRREQSADPISLPRDAINKLEVSRGRKSKAKGALIGALLGGAVGAVTAAVGKDVCKDSLFGGPACDAGAPEVAATAAGAGIGALVGALVSRGEKWQRVSTDKISIGLVTPGAGVVGLRLTLAF